MNAMSRPKEVLWAEVQMPRNEPNRTAWLLTCVDLTSLLVGFFVLLFSTQTLEKAKWEALAGGLQERFAAKEDQVDPVVVTMPTTGMDNAVVRVTGVKSGLGYLDALLHQRLQDDADWAGLRANRKDNGQVMTYMVPQALQHADAGDTSAAWARLAGVVRSWKNPVGVQVTTAPGMRAEAVKTAMVLTRKLAANGVGLAFAEVTIQEGLETQMVQLVVRAK